MKFHAGNLLPTRSFKKALCPAIIFALTVLLLFAAFDFRLIVRSYTIDAEDISSEIRIALVTDLHSCRYGEGQSDLIEAVHKLSPDLVLLGGDIFDDDLPNTNTELFLAGIADRYPCYYVTGNHEYWSGSTEFTIQMSILQKYGVKILSEECKTISVNGETINICGVDDPEAFAKTPDPRSAFAAQLENVAASSDSGHYTILLSHRPEYLDAYSEHGFDLVLCGHAHGGQWRLPWLLNGVFAPDQGLFPEYAGGRYTQADTTMIVSRGLARESTRIPRIFNRPELVLIEIK